MTMRKAPVGAILAATLLCLAGRLHAVERGTPDQAKAMLAKAIAHYKEVGRAKALADFTGKKPPFADRDLYVVCLGPDHTIVAHGAFPQFVGSSSDLLKDADGKPLGAALWDAAQGKGDGAVRYRWLNPVSGKSEPKVSFVQKAGDDACLVGAYNP
jgi:cytochrome c